MGKNKILIRYAPQKKLSKNNIYSELSDIFYFAIHIQNMQAFESIFYKFHNASLSSVSCLSIHSPVKFDKFPPPFPCW